MFLKVPSGLVCCFIIIIKNKLYYKSEQEHLIYYFINVDFFIFCAKTAMLTFSHACCRKRFTNCTRGNCSETLTQTVTSKKRRNSGTPGMPLSPISRTVAQRDQTHTEPLLLLSFSIYEKLIQFCSIDELGTNYPKDMFDPHGWSEDSYYEGLGRLTGKRNFFHNNTHHFPTSVVILN